MQEKLEETLPERSGLQEGSKEELTARIAGADELESLSKPHTILRYFDEVQTFLTEIGIGKETAKQIEELIRTKRSEEKVLTISRIFDEKLSALAEIEGVTGDPTLTFSERIALLGNLLFALKIVDTDQVLAEQVFIEPPRSRVHYKSFEKALEAYMDRVAFQDEGIFKSLLEDEFKGANSESKTHLLRSYLAPFIKVYDEGNFDTLTDRVIKFLQRTFSRIEDSIEDLSVAGLSIREAMLLTRLSQRKNYASERHKGLADDELLYGILRHVVDKKESLTALQRFFQMNRQISSEALSYLLSRLPTGESWGTNGENADAFLTKNIKEYVGTSWGGSDFMNLDMYILVRALQSTKGPVSSYYKSEINNTARWIIDNSKYIKGKKTDYVSDLRMLVLRLVECIGIEDEKS